MSFSALRRLAPLLGTLGVAALAVLPGCADTSTDEEEMDSATAAAITQADDLVEDKTEEELLPVLPGYVDRVEWIGGENVESAPSRDPANVTGKPPAPPPAEVDTSSIRFASATDDAHRKTSGAATWAYQFVAMNPDGTTRVMSTKNESRKVLGASTFKMFTAWAALESKASDRTMLDTMLTTSNNAMANLALCQAGAKLGGYTAKCKAKQTADAAMKMESATAELRKFLGTEGVRLSGAYKQVDGSGLETDNVYAVTDLMSLLTVIRKDEDYDAYKKLLAQPDKKGSTIRTRFQGLEGRVFAKTGTYPNSGNGVKALAGFVTPRRAGGPTLVFDIVCNDARKIGGVKKAFAIIEEVVRLHIRELDAQ